MRAMDSEFIKKAQGTFVDENGEPVVDDGAQPVTIIAGPWSRPGVVYSRGMMQGKCSVEPCGQLVALDPRSQALIASGRAVVVCTRCAQVFGAIEKGDLAALIRTIEEG